MKKTNLFIFFLVFTLSLNAQSTINFGYFPTDINDKKPIATSELLESLNWESIKEFSNSNNGHYAYTRKDSLLTEYEYVQQGRVASFEIKSFNGMVLEFYSEISNTSKPTNTNYFDKNIWLDYANSYLPNLPDSLKLTNKEPKNILKAYYQLLGVGTTDEYGWVCEYSTVGMPTSRRKAVVQLLEDVDLLWRLIDYPNIQTQLYVVDAIIYNDYRTKELIKERSKLLTVNSKILEDHIKDLKSQLLTKSEWNKIYQIRDSNRKVKTCGNMGSYKIYDSTTTELLSKEAIERIPRSYKSLQHMGYF